MRSRVFTCVVFSLMLAVPALADSGSSEYRAGEHAEKKNDYDAAYQAYKKAHDAVPSDAKYMAAFLRMRFYASSQHIHAGQTLRDEGKEEEALTEFRLAAAIDPSNYEAMGQVRRTTEEIQKQTQTKTAPKMKEDTVLDQDAKDAAGPVVLDFKSDFPVSIQMTATTDVIYKTIGKLGGFKGSRLFEACR